MKSTRYILRLVLTLFLITAVVAGLLAAVNAVTAPRIAAAQQEKLQKALKSVLTDAEQAETVEFSDESGMVRTLYASPGGYAAQVVTPGFGGDITMMVGVSKEGRILGISIISQTETPGLGAVSAADSAAGHSFRDSFTGLSGFVSVSKDGGEADTVTGATITSRAVTAGVNAALRCVADRIEQGAAQ